MSSKQGSAYFVCLVILHCDISQGESPPSCHLHTEMKTTIVLVTIKTRVRVVPVPWSHTLSQNILAQCSYCMRKWIVQLLMFLWYLHQLISRYLFVNWDSASNRRKLFSDFQRNKMHCNPICFCFFSSLHNSSCHVSHCNHLIGHDCFVVVHPRIKLPSAELPPPTSCDGTSSNAAKWSTCESENRVNIAKTG